MKRFIFWFRNCLLENNRGCSGFCGTCEHYHMCSCDGLGENAAEATGNEVSSVVDSAGEAVSGALNRLFGLNM